MNKYESIIIINPNCTDEALKALESKFTGLINENGKVESYENQGKKKLAYEVKKKLNKILPDCQIHIVETGGIASVYAGIGGIILAYA